MTTLSTLDGQFAGIWIWEKVRVGNRRKYTCWEKRRKNDIPGIDWFSDRSPDKRNPRKSRMKQKGMKKRYYQWYLREISDAHQ